MTLFQTILAMASIVLFVVGVLQWLPFQIPGAPTLSFAFACVFAAVFGTLYWG